MGMERGAQPSQERERLHAAGARSTRTNEADRATHSQDKNPASKTDLAHVVLDNDGLAHAGLARHQHVLARRHAALDQDTNNAAEAGK